VASKNKIGIEVQVEFPTVAELQRQLAEKWAKVKGGFEGKINVDIDGSSLVSAKSKIKKALSEEVFEIKLDVDIKNALQGINTVQKAIKELDAKLEKTREVKIDFKISDLDKSFRELLDATKKAENATDGQVSSQKDLNTQIDKSIDKVAKFQRIMKQNKDGTYATTLKWSENKTGGETSTITQRPDGRTDFDETHNREKALKEIEDVMKRIHRIELDQVDAEDKQFQALQKEKDIQAEQLELLRYQYRLKHDMNALEDDGVKDLMRVQAMNKEIKEQAVYAKMVAKDESEIAEQVAKVAQLEKSKQQIAMKMLTAKESELGMLREQYDHHNRIQDEIREQHNLQERMSDTQKESLDVIRRTGFLERERVTAKNNQIAKEAELTQKEKERQQLIKTVNAETISDLRNIHKIKQQIAQLEGKNSQSQSDTDRLGILREELNIAEGISNKNLDYLRSQQLITTELTQQMSHQDSINNAELDRIRRVGEVQNAQAEVNQKLQQYMDLTGQIGQLQRDLVFSGMREERIIEGQIGDLEEKRGIIEKSLIDQNQMTDAVKREVQQIQNAQSEQRELNRLRRDAREKDQSFNDTGGLVDPFQFAGNVKQGAMAIFEPIQRMDEALIGVSKVVDATDKDMREFAMGAYDVASSLGSTADEYVLAVEKWVTAGKNFNESQELAQVSTIGSFVGNINVEDMVKFMSVPMNAFQEEGLKSEDVINGMNETANNHAIEMVDLGKAYVRSATTAKNAGVSFGELTGMITGAQEATRKGGERIGTGIKTIGLNISGIQSQISADQKKKHSFLEDVIGIDLKGVDGEAKSMTEVLDQLNGKWDTLSKTDKNSAVTMIAGKEHAETLSAIIDQWERVEQVAGETEAQQGLGDKGSAYIEFAKQADSVKKKTVELKNAWDKLMATIGGNGGGVSKVLDILTNGLEELTKLANNEAFMNALKYIFAGVAIHAGSNLFRRFFDTVGTGFTGMRNNLMETIKLMGLLTKKTNRPVVPPVIVPPVVGGVGGRVARRQGTTGGTDGSDGGTSTGTGGTTAVVGGIGGRSGRNNTSAQDEEANRRAQQADEENNARIDRTNGKMATTGKLLKGFVGFIPLIGDALLIADLMGVPVFESLGKGFKGLSEDADELLEKIENAQKKFMATNSITNGNANEKDQELNGTINKETGKREGGIQQLADSSGKSDGFTSQEEFLIIQERLHKLAEDANIDVKLTLNDPQAIQDAIDKLDAGLNALTQKDMTGLGDEYNKQIEIMKEANRSMAEDTAGIEYLTAKKAENDEIIAGYQKQIDAGEELGEAQKADLNRRLGWNEQAKQSIEELQLSIQNQTAIFESANEATEQQSMSLANYIKQGGSLAGMSRDTAVKAVEPLIGIYNKLTDELNSASGATKLLNGTKKIEKDTYDQLVKSYPALSSISRDAINKSEEQREKAKALIKAEKEKKTEQQKTTKSAVDGLAKQGKFTDEVKGKMGEEITTVGKLKDEIKKKNDEVAKTKKEIKTTWSFKIAEASKSIWNYLKSGFKQNSVTTTANIQGEIPKSNPKGGEQDPSVSVGNGISSSNVSAVGGDIVKSPTGINSLAKSTKKVAEVNNSRVSGDVSRYWSKEMYGVGATDSALKANTDALNKAKDNQDQLIKLYQQQQVLMRQQIANYNSLYKSKDGEMNSTLNGLKKYGFKVDTRSNKVNNLGHASSLKGKNAEEAEKLLNTWKSLYGEMNGIKETISGINTQITETADKIAQAKIAKELKSFEKQLKKIDALLAKIVNVESINSKRLELVGSEDKEQELVETEKAMNSTKSSMNSLIAEFNALSKAKIANKENGAQLATSLKNLGDKILAQSDAVMKYQKALNELELSRVVDDLKEFNDAIDDNGAKITNNIDNLKEGLMNGTDIGDLQSSVSTKLDLNRDNAYEEMAKERIALEQEVQLALDSFGKKNVDRAKNVANHQLDIVANMYNDMLRMGNDYTAKKKTTATKIKAEFDDLVTIGNADEDYKYVDKIDDAYDLIVAKQDALTKKFEADMAKAMTPEAKEGLTDKYIIDSMRIQESYIKASINGSKLAIEELKKQLTDSTLDDETQQKIKDQIAVIEKDITDSQNAIKDSVKARFDFEYSLIQEATNAYDKYASELEYAMSILDSLGGSNLELKGTLLQELMEVEKARNSNIQTSLSDLQKQLKMYEQGSYEWNLINAEIEDYNKLLKDSNKELLEMNKNILSNSFDGTSEKIQKSMFDGKTLDDFKAYQELWMDGVEREIALEDAYQRMADLGTTAYNQKLALLEKQEKLSKFEMDYLNKQLDVLELQKKLENMNAEKTVQTLKQNENGTWDWEYTADAQAMRQAEEDLKAKERELKDAEAKAKEDYLAGLENIMTKAENGDYESKEEFEKALSDLGEAFGSIVGELPEIQDDYLKELIDAYAEYLKDNEDVIEGSTPAPVADSVYEGFSDEVVKAFDKIGDSMAKVFAETLLKALPNFGTPVEKVDSSKSVSVSIAKVDFPNATSTDDIQQALLSLPDIAMQKSLEK